jgi:hypothetical protein
MALQCRPALDTKNRKQSAKMFTNTSLVVNRPMNVVKTWQNTERSMKLLTNYVWIRITWRPRLLHIFRLFHFVNNLETPHHTGSITTFIIILKTYNACISLATSCHWAETSTRTFQLSTADMSFNFWIRDKYATSAVIYNSYQPCQCDSWNR